MMTLDQLFNHLEEKELLTPETKARIIMSLNPKPKDPIYIQVFHGLGAWFSSLFLILFLVLSEIITHKGGCALCGILFFSGAAGITHLKNNLFFNQLALAFAFAGNILLLVSVFEDNLLWALLIQGALCASAHLFLKSEIYKFCAPIGMAFLAVAWIAEQEYYVLIHVLIAMQAGLTGYLFLNKKLTALTYASAFMLPATVLFLNLSRDSFLTPLWPSSLILAVGLIFLFFKMTSKSFSALKPWMLICIISALGLGIFTTPGILVMAGLLSLGFGMGNPVLIILGYLFLPAFLGAYYQNLDLELMEKAWVFGGSGLIFLFLCLILRRVKPC